LKLYARKNRLKLKIIIICERKLDSKEKRRQERNCYYLFKTYLLFVPTYIKYKLKSRITSS